MNGNDSQRDQLIVSEKSLKHQLQMGSKECQEFEDFKYQFNETIARDRRPWSIVESPWDQLLSAWSDVDRYRNACLFIQRGLQKMSLRGPQGFCTMQ